MPTRSNKRRTTTRPTRATKSQPGERASKRRRQANPPGAEAARETKSAEPQRPIPATAEAQRKEKAGGQPAEIPINLIPTGLFAPMETAIRTAANFTAAAMGSAIGMMLGATRGAFAGLNRAVSETPALHFDEHFWRERFSELPYVDPQATYEDYRSAFHYGAEQSILNAGRSFDEIEQQLQRNWDAARQLSELTWDQVRDAVRDAYNRGVQSMRTLARTANLRPTGI